jgi:hypothetical protein
MPVLPNLRNDVLGLQLCLGPKRQANKQTNVWPLKTIHQSVATLGVSKYTLGNARRESVHASACYTHVSV